MCLSTTPGLAEKVSDEDPGVAKGDEGQHTQTGCPGGFRILALQAFQSGLKLYSSRNASDSLLSSARDFSTLLSLSGFTRQHVLLNPSQI